MLSAAHTPPLGEDRGLSQRQAALPHGRGAQGILLLLFLSFYQMHKAKQPLSPAFSGLTGAVLCLGQGCRLHFCRRCATITTGCIRKRPCPAPFCRGSGASAPSRRSSGLAGGFSDTSQFHPVKARGGAAPLDADHQERILDTAERAAAAGAACCKQPGVRPLLTTAERRGEPLPGVPVTAQREARPQGCAIRVEPWSGPAKCGYRRFIPCRLSAG